MFRHCFKHRKPHQGRWHLVEYIQHAKTPFETRVAAARTDIMDTHPAAQIQKHQRAVPWVKNSLSEDVPTLKPKVHV